MAKVPVIFAGKEYVGELASDKEKQLLFKHLDSYLAPPGTLLNALFKDNQESILGAMAVAKDKFDAPFGGILAADPQIGLSLIRPGHILRTTGATETPVNTWDTEGVVAGAFVSGEDNWIGYDTNNATAAHVDKENLILPLGLAWTQGWQSRVAELRFQVGETTYPVSVVRHAQLSDNLNNIRVIRTHPMLVEPKQTMYAQVLSETGGREEMVLLGLAFGMGRYLRTVRYTSVAI